MDFLFIKNNLYEVIGVAENASSDTIRKAYKKLALETHPDKVAEKDREDASVAFQKIKFAYEILIDEEKRSAYDNLLHNESLGPEFNSFDGDFNFDQQSHYFNEQDFWYEYAYDRPSNSKLQDEIHEFPVTLKDLYNGKVVNMKCSRKIICKSCKGKGHRANAEIIRCPQCKGTRMQSFVEFVSRNQFRRQVRICSRCKGSGKSYSKKDDCLKCKSAGTINRSEILKFEIIPGAMIGDCIRITGKGDEAFGHQPGDIVIRLVRSESDDTAEFKFVRRKHDLYLDVDVSLKESLCGMSRAVAQHINGEPIILTRKHGEIIHPNELIELKGLGMPLNSSKKGYGSLFLKVNVKFPGKNFLGTDKGPYADLEKQLSV